MSNVSGLLRALLIYGCCIPLAVVVGYLLATPLDPYSLGVVGILLLVLSVPLLLRWHHVWLIASWNMSAVIFFLPGRPGLWMGLAGASLAIGIVQYAINRNMKFLYIPSVTRPLLFLTIVVLVTARLTGGIGLKAMGSQINGGKYYVVIFASVIAYFALVSRPIPANRANLYVTLFFLGGATLALGELPRWLPPGFNFLFLIFPVMNQSVMLEQSGTSVVDMGGALSRITGLGFFGSGVFCAMLARYGIRRLFFEPGKLWRPIVLVVCMGLAMLSGFRSLLIFSILTFAVLFYLEGLHRTRLLPLVLIVGALVAVLVVAFANRMPLTIQRTMAFLPVDIDPMARMSAEASTAWRVQMWQEVLPEIPKYLIVGKGYGFSAREMAMLTDTRSGAGLESTEMAGDYHNGPLSVIMPFGIFGVIGFVWFLSAAGRLLYNNYKLGDPAYRSLNTFLFAYFVVKVFFFIFIFGSLVSDLPVFVGLAGLSISLNHGMARPSIAPNPTTAMSRFKFNPALRRPLGAQS
jgi:O-antigen ligase